jgi:hypothetical protein
MASDTADVVKCLALLIDGLFTGGGHPSSWSQRSYRDKIFALFEWNPALTGDGIQKFAVNLWPIASDERASEKEAIFQEICKAWDEWRYARDQLQEAQ